MELTREVARRCRDIVYADLADEVVDRTKYLLLDYLGVAIRGALSDSSKPVHRFVANRPIAEKAIAVCGTPIKVDAPYGGLALGVAAHSLELDDVVNAASLHPGVSVFSAAIAAGAEAGCSGRSFIEAVIAGYEVMVKLGIALDPAAHYAQGFHPTATCGTMGAAVSVGKLIGLDEQGLIYALGIGGSQAAGSMEFLSDGAYTKRFHAGWSAHAGIIAALLASQGFTGPQTILEGRFGFLHSYSPASDQRKVLDHWADPFEVMKTSIKPHACCRYKQGAIDCILQIMKGHELKAGDIEQVEVAILNAGFALVAEPHEQKITPKGIVDAQFSMPFGAAMAILYGNAFLDKYNQQNIDAPTVKELMSRVRCIRDPDIEKDFPQKWPARVVITTRDGRMIEQRIDHPKGDPENPLSWDELIDKFVSLASSVHDESRCRKIVAEVRQLETAEDIGKLLDLCAVQGSV